MRRSTCGSAVSGRPGTRWGPLTNTERRSRALSAALGALTGLATLEPYYYLSDAGLVALSAYVWMRGGRPHRLVIALAACVGVSALWAPVPWWALHFAARLLALGFVWPYVRRHAWEPRQFLLGMSAALLFEAALLVALLPSLRAPALALNASQVGQTGFALWAMSTAGATRSPFAATLAALFLVTGAARAAMIASALWAVLHPSKRLLLAFAVVALAFAAVAVFRGDAQRALSGPGYLNTLITRLETFTGPLQSLTALAPKYQDEYGGLGSRALAVQWYADTHGLSLAQAAEALPLRPPRFTLAGYGTTGYVLSTGLQRPHNVPLLVVYEMGLLAAVPIGAFAVLVWRRHVPWKLAAALLVMWSVTEEAAGRPEGYYLTAAVIAWHWRPGRT